MEKIYEFKILQRKCVDVESRIYFLKCSYRKKCDFTHVYIFYIKIQLTQEGNYKELQKYVQLYFNHWTNERLVESFSGLTKEQYERGYEYSNLQDFVNSFDKYK